MTWLHFIAATLACFRLTRLVTDDKITDWLRKDVAKAGKKAKEGINCPFCVSWWVASLIVIGLWLVGSVPVTEAWLWQPAIWGGSVLWNQLFMKLTTEIK